MQSKKDAATVKSNKDKKPSYMRQMLKKFHFKKGWRDASFTADELADLCGVCRSTAYEWIRLGEIPTHFRELVEFKALGAIHGTEDIWIDRQGDLTTSNGYSLNIQEVLAYSVNQTYRDRDLREVERLRDEVRRLRHWLELKQLEPPKWCNEPDRRSSWLQRRKTA